MHDHSGKPPVLPVDPVKIPGVLKLQRQWVCWKLKFEDGKWKKAPVDPKTGKPASVTDSSTWGTFDQAREYYARRKNTGIMGIGFVFTKDDPFTGVDLDHCRDIKTGDILPWALEIVEKLDSYTEISPSGTGLHIIVFGVLPPGKRKVDDVEMYNDVHYFTITGQVLPGVNQTVERRQKELKVLHAHFLGGSHDAAETVKPDFLARQGKASPEAGGWEALLRLWGGATLTPADLNIIRQFKAGRYGEMYRLLFMGDWEGAGRFREQGPYKSHSDADLALANRLARVTDGSPTRMYAISRESKLFMRDKIKDNRTYLARTIQRAIDDMNWRPAQASSMGRRGHR
jgi:putative DNA primase/helicase